MTKPKLHKSFPKFHHGGRIGDLFFALFTMRKLGGGELIVSDYHHPNWSLDIAKRLGSLLIEQPFIHGVYYQKWSELDALPFPIDFNLQAAEDDFNPDCFPEWQGKDWPGNCNIVKRYAVHFDVPYYAAPMPWLTAPKTQAVDIVFHGPSRRLVRPTHDWAAILNVCLANGWRVAIVGQEDRAIWQEFVPQAEFPADDWLTTADYVHSAKLMLGGVSSVNALAEGLGIPRLVEQAQGCDNVNVTHSLNNLSNLDITNHIKEYL